MPHKLVQLQCNIAEVSCSRKEKTSIREILQQTGAEISVGNYTTRSWYSHWLNYFSHTIPSGYAPSGEISRENETYG